jgi:hypothetical protein
LPALPILGDGSTATAQFFDLDDMPAAGGAVRLAGVRTAGGTPANVTTLEFGPLGETTCADKTVIWLMSDEGDARRFISITVDPITGITEIGDLQAIAPTGVVLPADVSAEI